MKKVLIITYYWPPAGGPGVQRVLKFAKYLPQFGWEPIILTVKDGNYPAIDESLLGEIHEGIKVVKTKTREPFALYNKLRGKSQHAAIDTFTNTKTNKSQIDKLAQLVRSYLFIPDARKGWKHYAVKEGIKIIENENVDLIFSSSPPHSLQLIAKKIVSKTKKPWIADFRDPWSDAFWLSDSQKNGFVGKMNVKLEKSVFKQLDLFTTVSQGVLENYQQQHQLENEKSNLIYNGFDETDFSTLKKVSNKIFTIRYVGTLAQSQNPTFLFEALASLLKEDIQIKLELWGKFDPSIKLSSLNCGLEDVVSFHPYVNHNKALDLMRTSDMLLLVIPFENSKGILTGKIFEYIATSNPILALGPKDTEAKEIIEENLFGKYFDSINGLSSYIKTEIYAKGTPKTINPNRERFSRLNACKQLVDQFNKVIAK